MCMDYRVYSRESGVKSSPSGKAKAKDPAHQDGEQEEEDDDDSDDDDDEDDEMESGDEEDEESQVSFLCLLLFSKNINILE